ncbi:MAG: hypothetical protein WD398_07080 [Cyclobacteriaceae bacterium]
MRIIKELMIEGVKVSIFEWNNKYILKFEMGLAEQTYKIPAADLTEEGELDTFFKGEFFEGVKERFHEMHQSLQFGLKNL